MADLPSNFSLRVHFPFQAEITLVDTTDSPLSSWASNNFSPCSRRSCKQERILKLPANHSDALSDELHGKSRLQGLLFIYRKRGEEGIKRGNRDSKAPELFMIDTKFTSSRVLDEEDWDEVNT